MTARTFTRDQLCLSPLNVRTNAEDANATDALEASIEEDGLIFPLIVHPMAPADAGPFEVSLWKPAHAEPVEAWGVLAGGRRFRAIARLIETGRFPFDWAIDCIVRDVDPGQITRLSLAENLLRRQLRPYEIHAAIAKAQERGASVDEIAASIGQRVQWVRQQMRLGRLAPEIFTEYAEGRLSAEQAMSYAATEDQDLQRAAFAHFRGQITLRHDAAAIRAFLKVGDREAERLLAFVGPVIYRAAGGAYELDLFADGPATGPLGRGRVTDEPLLRKLAENKLAHLRSALRVRAGIDVRFQSDPPQYGGTTDFGLEIFPAEVTVAGTLALLVPEGDVVATLTIGDDGEARARWWWASRKAKAAATKAPPKPAPLGATNASPAPAPSTKEPALAHSAEALNVSRSIRREILRALLVEDATDGDGDPLAIDYLIWAQLRQLFRGDPALVTGLLFDIDALDHEPAGGVIGAHLREIEANRVWIAAVDAVASANFITEGDPLRAFDLFRSSGLDVKAPAAAVLAGLMLGRSANTQGLRMPVHDCLAWHAGADDNVAAQLARPTSEYLGLFSKIERLALIQPHVDAGELRHLGKLRDRDLSRAVADRLAQLDWVHPLLRFGAAEPATAPTEETAA